MTGRQRRSYHHGDLRAALLEATVQIAREEGLDAVSVRNVARRVGVSEAAPYHHFADKVDLLGAAAALAYRAFAEALHNALAVADTDGGDPALAITRAYVEFGLTRPGEYQLMFGRHIVELGLETRQETRREGSAVRHLSVDAVAASLVARGISTDDVETVFQTVWAFLHGCVGLVAEKEIKHDVDGAVQLATDGVDALLRGLATH